MTLQEMMDAVKTNLGNRNSGTIGSQSVDVVVLSGINSGLNQILLKYNPTYYNRTAELAIVSGTREYTLPILDTNNKAIRIKDILSYRLSRTDGTDVSLAQMEWTNFIKRTTDYKLEVEGTPSIFSIWDKKIHFDMVPSENFTLELFIESYSVPLTTQDLGYTLPIESDWDVMLESFATSHVYLKLQQVQMAAVWNLKYEQQKSEVPGSARKLQQKGLSVGNQANSISDPVNDPFTCRWN